MVFVSASAADVVTAGKSVAVLAFAAAEFALGMLDAVIAVVAVLLPAVSVGPVVRAVLSAAAVELLAPVVVL